MNEIGEELQYARESSGVSLNEASKDLGIKVEILENIEDGRTGAFKDIFELKEYISNYAKYLGLNEDELIDEFNEYLFDETSKIPIDIIEQAKKEKKEDTEELSSPYTKKEKNKIKIPKIIIGLFILIILIIVGYIIASNYKGNDFSDNNITYSIRR